jgi:tellurite resistance protein TerC
MGKFHYLKIGLGLVLAFIGVKMMLAHTAWKIDTLVSLLVVILILAVSVIVSILKPRHTPPPSGPPR